MHVSFDITSILYASITLRFVLDVHVSACTACIVYAVGPTAPHIYDYASLYNGHTECIPIVRVRRHYSILVGVDRYSGIRISDGKRRQIIIRSHSAVYKVQNVGVWVV